MRLLKMIIKEKIIFFALLLVLAGTLVIGMQAQEAKKKTMDEFLKDIEAVTEKAKTKKKVDKYNWDIETLKRPETMKDYQDLAERGIFSRPISEVKTENKSNAELLEKEEPKKPLFVYKGRMVLGGKIIVIIEDQNTGKSFSVKEGDFAGEFTVVTVDDKEVLLRKSTGEEISVPTVKEEKIESFAGDTEGLNENK